MRKHIIHYSIIILFIGLFNSCAGQYFYKIAFARDEKSFLAESEDLEEIYDSSKPRPELWLENQDYAVLDLISHDDLNLKGYWLQHATEAGGPADKTVILFHGYSGQAMQMTAYARMFYEDFGFNVLAVDARGHGESEGEYIGFGWPERYDVIDWANLVVDMTSIESGIVLFGVSMGGATVMMASGEDLPPQVSAIIEDCGYSSIREELAYQLERMYHFKSDLLLNRVDKITQKKAGYSINEGNAVNQVARTDIPMLFIHGDSDSFVPTEMVYAVHGSHTGNKALYIVEGASHGLAYNVDPEAYSTELVKFLNQWTNLLK